VVAVLAVIVAVCSLVLSVIVFTIQRWDMRRRELWWAVVEDDGVEKGVPISFRLYRYIGKTKPKKRRHPNATIIRGYVLAGEALIGRERMSTRDATKYVQDRILFHGERNPDVPDEVHPPRITMVPLKVIHYGH
jgi:hypothetical protein